MKLKKIFFSLIFIISLAVASPVNAMCPANFDKYPLESEEELLWSGGPFNERGEKGILCKYVHKETENIVCDELAKKFGCKDEVKVLKREMRFNVFYIADQNKYSNYLKNSPDYNNWEFYCTDKSGWNNPGGDMFKPYDESFGDLYFYYNSNLKSYVRLNTVYKKVLPLDSGKVEEFSKELSKIVNAYSCPGASPQAVSAKDAPKAEEPQDKAPQASADEQGFGDWLREKILGTSEMKLDPREVEMFGEAEARRRQWQREWQQKEKEVTEDKEATAEEQGYRDWLKEKIFGKQEPSGALDPYEVEILGEEEAKRMQWHRELQQKQKEAGKVEEPSAEAQGYGDWLRQKMFGTAEDPPSPEEVEAYGELGARRRQIQREWQKKQVEVHKEQEAPVEEEQGYADWFREKIFGKPQPKGMLSPYE